MAVNWLISVPIVFALSAAVVLSCPVDNEMCTCAEIKNSETGKKEYVVDCEKLRLKSIPAFKKGQRVDKLLLGENIITAVRNNAFGNVSPAEIDLHGNIINTIEENAFKGMVERSLKVLNLSVNILDVTNVKSVLRLKSLEIFDLHSNKGKIPVDLGKGAFKGLSGLQRFFLKDNNIRSLNKSFDGLKQLRHLDLSNNLLESLSGSLNGLPNLESLDVSSNRIKPFPKEDLRKLSKLTDLSLQRNRIRKLSDGALDKTPALKRLHLGSNPIKNVEALNAPAFKVVGKTLVHLDISDCKLESTPVDVLKEVKTLESLDLSSNKIQTIPNGAFSSMTSLERLDLSGNPLIFSSEMFGGIEGTLKELSIKDLGLKNLPLEELKPLKKLEKIVASFNQLMTIKDKSLEGLSSWKYVLASNNLRYIAPGAFAGARKPVELDLQNNRMDNLGFVEDRCRFAFIDLTGNPILCDCAVWDLIRYDDLVVTGTCPSPREYENMEISGEEFTTVLGQACNTSKEEEGRCAWAVAMEMDELPNETSGTRDSTSHQLFCSLLVSLLFQGFSRLDGL